MIIIVALLRHLDKTIIALIASGLIVNCSVNIYCDSPVTDSPKIREQGLIIKGGNGNATDSKRKED